MLFSSSVLFMFKRLQKSRENRTCTDVLFIEYPHDLISDWLNSSKTYMSDRPNRIPSVNIYAVCFPNLHGMFCHLLWNIYVKTYRVNRAVKSWESYTNCCYVYNVTLTLYDVSRSFELVTPLGHGQQLFKAWSKSDTKKRLLQMATQF